MCHQKIVQNIQILDSESENQLIFIIEKMDEQVLGTFCSTDSNISDNRILFFFLSTPMRRSSSSSIVSVKSIYRDELSLWKAFEDFGVFDRSVTEKPECTRLTSE